MIHTDKKQDGIRGEKFAYAFAAAVKRTMAELEIIKGNMMVEANSRFANG